MRLFKYLLREDDVQLSIVKDRCKKIIDLYEKTNKFLYRGMKKDYDDLTLIKVRKDRHPKDMSIVNFEKFNAYFQEKFNYKARAEGLFTTSNDTMAANYGKEYIILPVGDDWKMIWSPKVKDLYVDSLNTKYVDQYKLMKSYIIGQEEKALMSGNEVMIVNCDEYYVINNTYNNLAEFNDLLRMNNVYISRDWLGGHWWSGIFNGGRWKDGIWEKGTWKGGVWKKGTWKGGVWESGNWDNGTWKGGTWEGGWWKGGLWEDGIWKDGEWKNGTWLNGTWYNGTWYNGIWEDGTWKNGEWHGGLWKDGKWQDGYWFDGTWEGGRWIKGGIYNPLKSKFEKSIVNPTEFYKQIGYKR